MRTWQRVVVSVVTAASLSGLVGCSDSGVAKADVYKVGCPALDAVVGGGSIGSKAAVAALRKARERTDLDDRAKRWLDAAIAGLSSTDPNQMPADARKLLVGGCQDHGYPLRNLRA